MKFKLNENIFDQLNKLEEELDPSIDGNEVLYEDNDYSKTPAQADNYRTDVEDVLGFELDGNQVQYLADNWPAFYRDANKYASMKDQILSFMSEEGLVDDNQLKNFDMNFDDDLDDIDYDEPMSDDTLHPNVNNGNPGGFQPLNVQSWETQPASEEQNGMTDINAMANEMVDDDDFDPEDEEMLNNILSGKD